MSNKFRLSTGGQISRTERISFKFNGKTFFGFKGDTLASALLANGVHLVGRSFKYHRPRGIFSSGVEETNALVQVIVDKGKTDPNLRATQIEIFEGFNAESQNCWPTVNFDVGAINNLFSPIIPAGFYYKTFMWPANLWEKYEHFIRRAAGLGKSPTENDPDIYDHKYYHCDVLIVGSGPAGLECSMQLARRGYHVILSEAGPELGGRVLFESGLKGLSAWRRVVDNRVYEIQQKNNIEIYKDSELTATHINELGIDNIFLATGASWRLDGIGRSTRKPIKGLDKIKVLSPEEAVKNTTNLKTPIIVYDDEQGYLAGVIADHLSAAGHKIVFLTPASVVSPWTESTLEQTRVQRSLLNQGVEIICNKSIQEVDSKGIEAKCVFTGKRTTINCKTIIMVTERIPNYSLFDNRRLGALNVSLPLDLKIA